MTAFLVACAALALVMVGLVAWPLLRVRAPGVDARDAVNVDLYRQRLAEIDAERARGELADQDYETLKAELAGNLLDDVEAPTAPAGPSRARRTKLAAGLGLALLGAGAVLYGQLGALDLVVLDQNRALLADAKAPEERLGAWADGLEAHLADHPDDAKSWYLLGHARLRQDRYESAVSVFETLAALTEDDPVVLASLAQARYLADKGVISDANRATMMRVLEAEPHEANIREMLALDAFRRKNFTEAAEHLELALAGGVGGARAEALEGVLERARASMPPEAAAQAGPASAKPLPETQSAAPIASAGAVPPSAEVHPETQSASPIAGAGAVPPQAELQRAPSMRAAPAAPIDGARGIRIRVSLAPGVAAAGRIFVIARESGGPPMPVAVKVLSPADLPVEVVLSDADAMQPERALSQFERLEVLARLSKSGNAMRGADDVESAVVPVMRDDGTLVELEIGG